MQNEIALFLVRMVLQRAFPTLWGIRRLDSPLRFSHRCRGTHRLEYGKQRQEEHPQQENYLLHKKCFHKREHGRVLLQHALDGSEGLRDAIGAVRNEVRAHPLQQSQSLWIACGGIHHARKISPCNGPYPA